MIRDNYYKLKNPSIDRKNSNKNYILNNCRFIELGKNTAERNRRVSRKPTLQFDLNNKFIREFESLTQASVESELAFSNISACINGKQKTCGGYKWQYKEK